METFSALLAFCAGNSPVTGEFPAQRPVTRSFDVSFICAWTNRWVHTRDVGDSRHHAHYDITVVKFELPRTLSQNDHIALVNPLALLTKDAPNQ